MTDRIPDGTPISDLIDAREAERVYPIGATVTTIVYSIGGRSETVSGDVVGYRHRGRSLDVKTPCHGTIIVPVDKIIAG